MAPHNPSEAAAVLAALSPRVQWADNVHGARVLYGLAEGRLRAFCRQVRKARAIRAGADPDAVLRGPKERAFWRAITGDVDSVTVDRWAYLAAMGEPSGRRGIPAPMYARLAAAYADAADLVGESPRDMQAIVWGIERGEFV
jgi:hypothetical protein